MEAGKKCLAGNIVRQANTGEVSGLHREGRDLKEVVAEQTLELRLLKKSTLVRRVSRILAISARYRSPVAISHSRKN